MERIKYPCNIIDRAEVFELCHIYNLPVNKNSEHVDYGNYHNEESDIKVITISILEELNKYDLEYCESLTFDYCRNLSINNIDWKNVTYLGIFGRFDQSINDVDWKNITTLEFVCNFDQPINEVDWKNITFLHLGEKCNQPINGMDWSAPGHRRNWHPRVREKYNNSIFGRSF